MTFFIRKDGSVDAIYDDSLSKANLGVMKVSRASSVEFDNDQKKWNVTMKTPSQPALFDSRQAAIAFEISQLNQWLRGNNLNTEGGVA